MARPLPLGACPADEVGLPLGELVVLLTAVAAGGLALLEVRVITAAEDAVAALGEVEFQYAGDAAGEELSVMAHEHHAAAQPAHESLEPLEPVEVEVVRGFVEQHDVEAGQQQGREADTGGLAARERGHRRVCGESGPGGESELAEHLGHPLVEIGGSAGEPAFEGVGVGVGGVWAAGNRGFAERRGRRVHLGGGSGASGAATDVGGDAFPGAPFVLLREGPDERVDGGEGEGAELGLVLAREEAEKGRLARAVHADDADDIARGDGEVEVRKKGAVGVAAREPLRHEGRRH